MAFTPLPTTYVDESGNTVTIPADRRNNPILSVSGNEVPCPSAYSYNIQDISDSDAGRDESGTMHTDKICAKITIGLEWQAISTADLTKILTAFGVDYGASNEHKSRNIRYFDPIKNAFIIKTFYVGDRSTSLYNAKMGVWESVSFNIIEM